jgi:hypothetical protein
MVASDARLKRLDGFAVLAFCLAFLILFLPTGADICFWLLLSKHYIYAAILAVVCYAIVLVPFIVSWRRQFFHYEHWRGRGYFVGTAMILGLHAVFYIIWLAQQLVHFFPS